LNDVKDRGELHSGARVTYAVAHERLPDAEEAEASKLSWRRGLSDLKSVLES
jgi:hypothetical protein